MNSRAEYRRLLVQYVPQPIRSAQDYRRAVRMLEEVMAPKPSAARSCLIEVLSTLIEKYESREFPTPQVAPPAVLAHLLNSRSLKPVVVARATGIPAATLSNVLAQRRGVSKENAIKLGAYFGVSPMVFLTVPESDRAKSTPKPAPAR